MPICTYLSNSEIERYKTVEDEELNKLLQEVRERTGEDWLISQYKKEVVSKRGLFKKPEVKIVMLYSLYVKVVSIEYQEINFRSAGEGSINTMVSLETMSNFLMGMVIGFDSVKKVHGADGL